MRLLSYLFIALFLFSCTSVKSKSKNKPLKISSSKINIDKNYSKQKDVNGLRVDGLVIYKDKLNLTYQYNGGCKDHSVTLFTNAKIKEHEGEPALNIFIEHEDNNDLCKAIKKKTETFNLKNIWSIKEIDTEITLLFQGLPIKYSL